MLILSIIHFFDSLLCVSFLGHKTQSIVLLVYALKGFLRLLSPYNHGVDNIEVDLNEKPTFFSPAKDLGDRRQGSCRSREGSLHVPGDGRG